MQNILWFNISKLGGQWKLTGQVGDEKITETHKTQEVCKRRAIEIMNASNYLSREGK